MNGYVPWDVSYLTKFYDWVLNAIGSATNIGIGILAIVVAILVAIAVVRHFTK